MTRQMKRLDRGFHRYCLWVIGCLMAGVSWCGQAETPTTSLPLTLVSGWVRETPPNAANGVAFMTLRNGAEADVVIDAVGCEAASSCELHQHTQVNGNMRMQKVASLSVPAGGEFRFATGGYHVMLLGLHAPVKAGQSVVLTLLSGGVVVGHCVLPVKSVRDE